MQSPANTHAIWNSKNVLVTKCDHDSDISTVLVYDDQGARVSAWQLSGFQVRRITKSGLVVAVNDSDGLATDIRLYTISGELLREIKPFANATFDDYAIDDQGDRLLLVTHKEMDPYAQRAVQESVIIIFNSAGKKIELKKTAELRADSVKLADNHFVIHNNYVADNRHITQLIIYSLAGEPVASFVTFAYHYVFREATGKVLVADRQKVKQLDLSTNREEWTVSYEQILKGAVVGGADKITAIALAPLEGNRVLVVLSKIQGTIKNNVTLGLIGDGKVLDSMVVADKTAELFIDKLDDKTLAVASDQGVYTVTVVKE